jgi:hypothetical protein
MFRQQNVENLEAADQFGDLNIELINRQNLRVDQGDLVEDRTKLTHPISPLSQPDHPKPDRNQNLNLKPRLEANLQTRCDKNV